MAEVLTSVHFFGFFGHFIFLQLWAWFFGTWIAAFCCVGSDIAVPIFPFVVLLTRPCLIYFLLPRALLILVLVWGCAFGLVIPGFIRLALFFLFRCFYSSRWDCCACLFSTLFPFLLSFSIICHRFPPQEKDAWSHRRLQRIYILIV